jgi:CRISPR-associated protein Csm3
MKNKLEKKIIISVPMKLITGMRIGDSKETVEIGGVDNPVIRRRDNNEPYIPGSSLKGKIRCLLEQAKGENQESDARQENSMICKLFGAGDNKSKLDATRKKFGDADLTDVQKAEISQWEGNKSRIIVRDAYLTRESANKLLHSEHTDMPYTEVKWENVINRIKGTAEHPRQMERIPSGAEFQINFVINIFTTDGDGEKLKEQLIKGLRFLETDYLGGSGSRGYGQVEFGEMVITEKLTSEYLVEA